MVIKYQKYIFVPCLGIVLSIVVTFLAAQKMLIYSPHIHSLAPTLPEGQLLKWCESHTCEAKNYAAGCSQTYFMYHITWVPACAHKSLWKDPVPNGRYPKGYPCIKNAKPLPNLPNKHWVPSAKGPATLGSGVGFPQVRLVLPVTH